MKVAHGNVLNALLVAASLAVVALRFYCRIFHDNRRPIAADYVALAGWFCSLGLIICFACAYHITPNDIPNSHHTSVPWLKISYASLFFYDIGLILPKVSITMFYWWLIPPTSDLRKTLWCCTAYVACAFLGIFFSDLLFCLPISDNWSVENQLNSVWNSPTNITLNWSLNISTDCILSTLRYALPVTNEPHVFPIDAAAWYVAETCTATIVVCLPSLRPLLVKCVEKLGASFGSTTKTTGAMNTYLGSRGGRTNLSRMTHARGTAAGSPDMDESRLSEEFQSLPSHSAPLYHSAITSGQKSDTADEAAQAGVVMVVTEVSYSTEADQPLEKPRSMSYAKS